VDRGEGGNNKDVGRGDMSSGKGSPLLCHSQSLCPLKYNLRVAGRRLRKENQIKD
jgi:hypothetical protein